MLNKVISRVGNVLLIGLFFVSCGENNSANKNGENSKNSIENKKLSYHGFEVGKVFNPWDSNSVKFDTSSVGGEGPAPWHDLGVDHTPDIRCQKGSKWFEFLMAESLLKIEVCEDIHKEPKTYTKRLDHAEKSEVVGILSGMQSIVRKRTGLMCPLDGGSNSDWMQVYQKDGTIRILKDENVEKCGEESSKYLHGTAPDLSFLKRFEEIVFSAQE